MIIVVVSFFLLFGASFTLLAAVGVVRMPDLFCRMHAATKAGAFGLAAMLLAMIAANPTPRCIIQSGLILIFFYLTAPVAAQMIGRVGVRSKIFFYTHRDDSKPKQEAER